MLAAIEQLGAQAKKSGLSLRQSCVPSGAVFGLFGHENRPLLARAAKETSATAVEIHVCGCDAG
jgi:hypothetical protein